MNLLHTFLLIIIITLTNIFFFFEFTTLEDNDDTNTFQPLQNKHNETNYSTNRIDKKKDYNSCGVIYHYHIPSTGGTTIFNWLKQSANSSFSFFTEFMDPNKEEFYAKHAASTITFVTSIPPKTWNAVQSHNFNYGINATNGQKLIEKSREILLSKNCSLITTIMFRDPLTHLLSIISASKKFYDAQKKGGRRYRLAMTRQRQHCLITALNPTLCLRNMRRLSTANITNERSIENSQNHNQTLINLSQTNTNEISSSFNVSAYLNDFFSPNTNLPKSQLDYFLYNKKKLGHYISAKQKVSSAMTLLKKHFDFVFFEDFQSYQDEILRITNWSKFNLIHVNQRNDELFFNRYDISLMVKFLRNNGDYSFIELIKFKYGKEATFHQELLFD